MNLESMQEALSRESCDAWILYDFRGSNPIARRIGGLDSEKRDA
jgi:hypothetical protein